MKTRSRDEDSTQEKMKVSKTSERKEISEEGRGGGAYRDALYARCGHHDTSVRITLEHNKFASLETNTHKRAEQP
jgi:hypothetical protein